MLVGNVKKVTDESVHIKKSSFINGTAAFFPRFCSLCVDARIDNEDELLQHLSAKHCVRKGDLFVCR